MWTASHVAAHMLIFVAYLAAVVRVPSSFQALIRLRPRTMIAGAGFFLFCGVTHLALALGESNAWWVTVTDHLQAVAIIGFLISLTIDLSDAIMRLAVAFRGLREEFGDDTADRMTAIITAALQGTRHP